MSRTYDIICTECKKALWIAQAGGGNPRGHIYKTPEALADLDKFLWDHEGHSLKFVNDQTLDCEGYEEINL